MLWIVIDLYKSPNNLETGKVKTRHVEFSEKVLCLLFPNEFSSLWSLYIFNFSCCSREFFLRHPSVQQKSCGKSLVGKAGQNNKNWPPVGGDPATNGSKVAELRFVSSTALQKACILRCFMSGSMVALPSVLENEMLSWLKEDCKATLCALLTMYAHCHIGLMQSTGVCVINSRLSHSLIPMDVPLERWKCHHSHPFKAVKI